MRDYTVFFGTYNQQGPTPREEGIYVYQFDAGRGQFSSIGVVSAAPNPSFLTLSPDGHCLYCTHELVEYKGQPGGGLSAFSLDSDLPRLLNSQPTHGVHPCYIAVNDHSVFTANYTSGSLTVYPRHADGRLGEPAQVIKHEGHSIHVQRQESAHVHSTLIDLSGKYLIVADLGIDKLVVYRMENGPLVWHSDVSLSPGSGPRHTVFHPNGRWLYCSNELASTVTAFQYDSAQGTLREFQTIAGLPQDFAAESTAAHIAITPNGHFLYMSNRGHDSLAMFAVDGQTGRLTATGFTTTLGKTPRNFAIDPAGEWLVAANQDSDSVVLFRIHQETGALTPTGLPLNVPTPVFVLFALR